MNELDFSQRTEKVSAELLQRVPHNIDNPSIIAEISKKDYLICGQNYSFYVDNTGKTKQINEKLYTAKYIPELDMVIGITIGLSRVTFLNNLPGFPSACEPIRTKINFINQIEYRDHKLVLGGSGVDIYEVTIKKVHFDAMHPIIELKLIASFTDNLYGSQYGKVYVDFNASKILVPKESALIQYSFDGSIVNQIKTFSPMIMRTTAMQEITGKPPKGSELFKKFLATDSHGTIRIWNSSGIANHIRRVPNEIFIYSEFVDNENALLVSEDDTIYVFNTKSEVITEVMKCKNEILSVTLLNNPSRIAIVHHATFDVFTLNVPWKFFMKLLLPITQMIPSGDNFIYLDDCGSVAMIDIKTKEPAKYIPLTSQNKVQKIFVDGNDIFYLFNNNKMQKVDQTSQATTDYSYEVLFFGISPDKRRKAIITTQNELVVLDSQMLSITGKTRIGSGSILDMQVLDHCIIVFQKTQILFISDTMGVKIEQINEIAYVSHSEDKFCLLHKNGQLTICDSNKLTVLCTTRCGKDVSMINLQDDYFIIIKENGVIFVGRLGCKIVELRFSFKVIGAIILGTSEDLLVSSDKFIAIVYKEERYHWMTKQNVEGYKLFQSETSELPKLALQEVHPPRDLSTSVRKGAAFRTRRPIKMSATARDIQKISLKLLFQESRAMNKSEEKLGLSQLPDLKQPH